MNIKFFAISSVSLFACFPLASASILINGDFEDGIPLNGWTVSALAGSSGAILLDDADGLTPISGLSTVGPAGGASYAVSDQTGPGTYSLIQAFTAPLAGGPLLLSFDMFVNDWSGVGPIVDPLGLDHNGGANQHARVDLLTSGAGPFDTGAGVLANLYIGVDLGPAPHGYTPYVFDLSSFVTPGLIYQIRFAETDNQGFLNMGVDNVSLVPEASESLVMLLGMSGLLANRRRRK